MGAVDLVINPNADGFTRSFQCWSEHHVVIHLISNGSIGSAQLQASADNVTFVNVTTIASYPSSSGFPGFLRVPTVQGMFYRLSLTSDGDTGMRALIPDPRQA